MPISDRLVLAADVSITPASELPPGLRTRLGARRGDAAITRLRGRAPAKLVDRQGALLLAEFRQPCLVAEAIRASAVRLEVEPAALLDEAFPLLRDCYNSRFLVVADSPEASPLLPTRDRGDRIGRFRVLRCLRVLEDTELYQARDATGTMAAIKLARPGITARGLFRREAAALERLDGDLAPRGLGTGTHRGRPWLAMTWCGGISPDMVAAELRRTGDRGRLLALVTRIARRYARLHRRGLLHGDVHPRNLLVERDGTVRLVDFGLALPIAPQRLAGRHQRGGVPAYHAPEQAAAMLAGESLPLATPGSEQFALATMLVELVIGVHPLELSLDRATLLAQLADNPPVRFTHRGAPAWPALEAVLARARARDPRERFASVAELAAALAAVPVPRASVRRGSDPHRRTAALERTVRDFLERTRFDGPLFRGPGRAPHGSVMLGRAGTAYALYRLACLRDDPLLLARADAVLAQVEASSESPLAFASPDDGLGADGLGPVNPFHSLTGVLAVRTLIALAMQQVPQAAEAVRHYVQRAAVTWPRRDLTLGRMGVVHGATLMLEALPVAMEPQRRMLRGLGTRMVAALWRELAGLGRIGSPGHEEDHGVAHGWAGLILATLRWHAASGAPLPRALAPRLAELARGGEPLGRGVHWAQRVTGSLPSLLAAHQVAGWCNGPAGFVHLFTLAQRHFPEAGYEALATASAWSTWEAPSEVFDLCCGLTGRAYALLTQYRATGDPEWLERAGLLADRAMAAFVEVRPGLPRPLSLFKGEAGLAVLAEDLRHPERAAFPFFEPEGFPTRLTHG